MVFDHGFSGPKSFSFVVPHVFMDGAAVNTLRLADLTPGKSAVVTAISGAGRVASRLMEMGFVPGTIVEVLRRAPFGDGAMCRHGAPSHRHRLRVRLRPLRASSRREPHSRIARSRPGDRARNLVRLSP